MPKKTIMKIHIARNGQSLGQFDEEQLTEQLEQGTVSYDDLAWVEGMSEWLPLRQITSGSTEVRPPVPSSIASPRVDAATPKETMPPTNPKLWNPKAAALWSILFTSVLGSFLHWRNALALGRAKEAATNLKWFYVGLVGWAMYMLRDHCAAYPGLHLLMSGAWIVLLVAWYFTTGKRQVGFVKENFPTGYYKKGWLKPIGVMLMTIICLVLADVAIPERAEENDTPQTKQENGNQPPKVVVQKVEIQKQVKNLFAHDLATEKDFKNFGLKVKDVILVQETEKKYTGYAVVGYQGQDHKVSITVKTDGDTIMYETEPLDFVPGEETKENKQTSNEVAPKEQSSLSDAQKAELAALEKQQKEEIRAMENSFDTNFSAVKAEIEKLRTKESELLQQLAMLKQKHDPMKKELDSLKAARETISNPNVQADEKQTANTDQRKSEILQEAARLINDAIISQNLPIDLVPKNGLYNDNRYDDNDTYNVFAHESKYVNSGMTVRFDGLGMTIPQGGNVFKCICFTKFPKQILDNGIRRRFTEAYQRMSVLKDAEKAAKIQEKKTQEIQRLALQKWDYANGSRLENLAKEDSLLVEQIAKSESELQESSAELKDKETIIAKPRAEQLSHMRAQIAAKFEERSRLVKEKLEDSKPASSDIQSVKDGIMFLDKSTTIGKAFAGYPFFKSVKWSEQKLSSGGKRIVVEGIADWDKIKPADYAKALVKANLSPEELLNSSEDMKDAERTLNGGRIAVQKMVVSYVLRFVFSLGMDDSIKLQDVQLILTKSNGEKAEKTFNDKKLEKHTLQQIFEGGLIDVMLFDIVQAGAVEKG